MATAHAGATVVARVAARHTLVAASVLAGACGPPAAGSGSATVAGSASAATTASNAVASGAPTPASSGAPSASAASVVSAERTGPPCAGMAEHFEKIGDLKGMFGVWVPMTREELPPPPQWVSCGDSCSTVILPGERLSDVVDPFTPVGPLLVAGRFVEPSHCTYVLSLRPDGKASQRGSRSHNMAASKALQKASLRSAGGPKESILIRRDRRRSRKDLGWLSGRTSRFLRRAQ